MRLLTFLTQYKAGYVTSWKVRQKMNDQSEIIRPDPDTLLNRLKQDEIKSAKGKLKIFFGMCAGVGKTYAMLKAAHKAKADGINVVIGIVETHKRLDTEELLEG